MSSPPRKLAPPAWDALAEALSTFEWYKTRFESLVRRLFADAPTTIARLNFAEPKRRVADELVDALRRKEAQYQEVVIDALVELAEFDPDFPHPARLEDGSDKVWKAQAALSRVKAITERYSDLAIARERLRTELAQQNAASDMRRAHDAALQDLLSQFLALHTSANPQARGIAFEGFLNSLFALWDLDPRAAYSLEHEQVDGAFTFRTDDYLLEARWWVEPLQPKELNDFKVKVDGKARNTLGLCVAVNGFTDGAVELHSRPQTPLVLMDGADLMPILEGRIGLDEVLERKRRHAAETGRVMYRAVPS